MKNKGILFFLLLIATFDVLAIEPGQPYNKMALPDLSRKFHRTSDIFDGSWVVLDFFRTDCKPCIKELPEINALIKEYQGKGYKIKGYIIATDTEGLSVVRKFFENYETVMTVLLDRFQKMAERYDVETIPYLYLISPDGKVVFRQNGYSETLVSDLRKYIKK